MKTGDYVIVKGDLHIYQIKDIHGNELTIEDGHKKLYTVDQSKVKKYPNLLKADSQNNITIHPIKTTWTREELEEELDKQAAATTAQVLKEFEGYKSLEEVTQLCYQAFIHHKSKNGEIRPIDAMDLIEPFEDWIKENLK